MTDPMSGMAAAGIQGAAGLVGGLFSLAAEKKKREMEALKEGMKARAEGDAMTAKTVGDQTPFQNLMASYGFLGKRGM